LTLAVLVLFWPGGIRIEESVSYLSEITEDGIVEAIASVGPVLPAGLGTAKLALVLSGDACLAAEFGWRLLGIIEFCVFAKGASRLLTTSSKRESFRLLRSVW
jgi:hypothetical protein